MGGEITNLKVSLSSTIIPAIVAKVPDVAFGLVDFKDFAIPADPSCPFVVLYRYRITTVATQNGVGSVQNAVNSLSAAYGGDEPEAGWEAMYSIAGGPAITVANWNSVFDLANTNPNPPPAGESQGTVGGAGFRTGAVPIVITISDAGWHDAPNSGGLDPYSSTFNGVPSRAQAIAQLNSINARVISIASAGASSTDPRTQGKLLAEATGAVVSPSAWGTSRPAGCTTTQCCTGLSGAGEATSNGLCPLVYRIASDGTGLSTAVVDGVKKLIDALTPKATSTTVSSSNNPSVTGQTVTFTATVSDASGGGGTPAGTVTFSDGGTTIGTGTLSSGQATFGTPNLSYGSHDITATYEGDASFAGSTSSVLTQVVQIGPPASVVATATTNPTLHVEVTWPAVSGAASYLISRSDNGADFTTIGSSPSNSYNDNLVSADKAYLYFVRAVDGADNQSAASAADLATTFVFAGDVFIRGAHINQLRTAINAVRTIALIGEMNFGAAVDSTTKVQAAHVMNLRNALVEARNALALPAIAFTDPTITAGATKIKAAHITELRDGVK